MATSHISSVINLNRGWILLAGFGILFLVGALIFLPLGSTWYLIEAGGRSFNSAAQLEGSARTEKYESARAYYQAALNYRPEDPHILRQLAKIDLALGEPSLALSSLDKYTQERPNNPLGQIETALNLEKLYDQTVGAAAQHPQTGDLDLFGILQRMGLSWEAGGYGVEDLVAEAQHAQASGRLGDAWRWFRRAYLVETGLTEQQGVRLTDSFRQIVNADFLSKVETSPSPTASQERIEVPTGWSLFAHAGGIGPDWVSIVAPYQGDSIQRNWIEVIPKRDGLDLVLAATPIPIFGSEDFQVEVEGRNLGSGAVGRLELQLLDFDGNPIHVISSPPISGGTTWDQLQLSGEVGEEVGWLVLRLRVLEVNEPGLSIQFRNPSISLTGGSTSGGGSN